VISSTRARVSLLTGVAVLAVALALVFSPLFRHKAKSPSASWFTALAAPYAPAAGGKTACGRVIGPGTIGVAHPVLPCGAKLELEFGGKHVFTRVIDRAPSVPGRTFDLTHALARMLGIQGTQTIQWRFAR
jgi:rare lipoprotein A (peptidoglycan hydrolase)